MARFAAIALCFLVTAAAAEDRGVAPHFDFAAELLARDAVDVGGRLACAVQVGSEDEIHVRVARGEMDHRVAGDRHRLEFLAHALALLDRGRLAAQGGAGEVLRSERLEEVYGCELWVGEHPEGSGVAVLPPAGI